LLFVRSLRYHSFPAFLSENGTVVSCSHKSPYAGTSYCLDAVPFPVFYHQPWTVHPRPGAGSFMTSLNMVPALVPAPNVALFRAVSQSGPQKPR